MQCVQGQRACSVSGDKGFAVCQWIRDLQCVNG